MGRQRPQSAAKTSIKAKVTDTKVVLSLPEFDRILTMRTLGSDTNVLDDPEQIKRIVTEGDKRLMVLLLQPCEYEDDDDLWEDYVGMMEVDTIEDLEPDSFRDFTMRWFLGRRGRRKCFRTQKLSKLKRNGLVCANNTL